MQHKKLFTYSTATKVCWR